MQCGVRVGRIGVMAIALLAGAISGQARQESTRYTDKAYGYSLTPPPGWTRKTDMAKPYVAFVGPEVAGFQSNLNIYTEPAANKTLAQYVRVSRETISTSKAMRLQSERKATLGGSPAQMLQSLVAAGGQPPAAVRQIVAVHGGRGYIVTFTAPPPEMKKDIPVFDKVLSSFHWQK